MNMRTVDSRQIDSTGAFLIGQLEQLDPTVHMPLQNFTWSRDINVRTDVTMGHDFSSYTNVAMAAVGGIDPNKKAFISKESTTLPAVAADVGKTASPLIPWGMELGYSVFELESMQLLGQSLDDQKFEILRRKHQQDIDIQVYLGDTSIPGCYGFLNSPQITNKTAVAANGTGSPATLWSGKTPAQILADVNELETSVWTTSVFEYCPTKILISPAMFSYILTTPVTAAGADSILTYIKKNSIALQTNGVALEIQPSKWCVGTNNGNTLGVNATDMMIAYTQRKDLLRFPMVPMVGMPMQFKGINHLRPYICKLGVVEIVYPETLGIRTGIN